MLPDLVVDENVDFRIVRILRNSGFEVFSVVESCPGSSDREALDFARKRKALLVTEDHDFGEWVFAHHEPSFGVKYQAIAMSLIQVLNGVSLEDIRILAPFLDLRE